MGNCQAASSQDVVWINAIDGKLKSSVESERRRRSFEDDPGKKRRDDHHMSVGTFQSSSCYTTKSFRTVQGVEDDPAVDDSVVSGSSSDSSPRRCIPESPNPAQPQGGADPVIRNTSGTRLTPLLATTISQTSQEKELGTIQYHFADMEKAKEEARQFEMPLLRFDIEVPGDSRIGEQVLSHPLIAEAAELLFVSVVPEEFRIHRENAGKRNPNLPRNATAISVLEPSTGSEIGRVGGDDLCVADVAQLMIKGLKATDKPVPAYLSLLHEEESGHRMVHCGPSLLPRNRLAIFAVKCCRVAEVEFAGLQGVLSTRAGICNRHALVQVTYDSSKLSYCTLVRFAIANELAKAVYYQSNDEHIASQVEVQRVAAYWNIYIIRWTGASFLPSVDPKHYLRTTLLKYVPLTGLQALRANRLIQEGAFHEAVRLLSPRQGMLLMQAMKCASPCRPEYVDIPFVDAWKSVTSTSTKRPNESSTEDNKVANPTAAA
jgi:hypothetical protein